MRLVKISQESQTPEDIKRDGRPQLPSAPTSIYDVYEVRPSQGEEAVPRLLTIEAILENARFKAAVAPMYQPFIYSYPKGRDIVLRVRSLHTRNSYQHAIGDGIEIGMFEGIS